MKLLANKRALAVVAALGLVASLLVWTLSRGDELGEMRVQADKGTVEIERDGSLIRVGGQNPVEPGDVVSTAEGSFATVRLERDRLIYLGPRTSVEILGGSGVAGEMGTFVADAPDDPLRIALGDSVGRSDGGTFRVDVDLGTTRAASYLGSLQLSAPGSPDLRLGTLWQTTITAGQLFGREPYELREKDHWDADFLDSVVELDDRLTQLKLSFTPLVGRSLPNLEYFGALVGQKGEGMSFLRSYTDKLSRKRPGYTVDIMLGLTLARAADGRLGSNFERVFGYRQQGATWGVAGGLLGLRRDEQWKRHVKDLEVAMLGSSGVADGDAEEPTFTLAEDGEPVVDGGSIDGGIDGDGGGDVPGGDEAPPPAPDDGGGDDGGGDDGGDDDGGGDDDDGGGGNPSPPPPCDVQCEVEKVIPDPEPTNLDPPPGN